MNKILFSLHLFFSASVLFGSTLELKNSKGLMKSYDLQKLGFELKAVEIFEPHEKKDLVAQAYSFSEVMDKLSPGWRSSEEVLFTCLDGYQPSIPVEKFLKYDAYFAVGFKGRKKFHMIHPEKKSIDVGPFYMVWRTKDGKKLNDLSSMWAYQVKAIELIKFSDKFPKMSPPKGSGEKVKKGFVLFREKCMSCHKMNGEGGDMGPELNYPVSVTQYFKPKWLKQWIIDPASVRQKTKMPKLFSGTPQSHRRAQEIILYLRSMSHKKISP